MRSHSVLLVGDHGVQHKGGSKWSDQSVSGLRGTTQWSEVTVQRENLKKVVDGREIPADSEQCVLWSLLGGVKTLFLGQE